MGIWMPTNSRTLYIGIQNTLSTLSENGLTIYYNNPILKTELGKNEITWPNHVSGDHNCEHSFTTLHQYRMLLQTQAFTCLLFDGSIVRAFYSFVGDELARHSILWWPAPFPLKSEDLELGGVLEMFELYSSGKQWAEHLEMRTPIRFDYDVANSSKIHPAVHMHMQASDCRLHVDRPLCFNRFIKFIFYNYYPDIYTEHDFFEELKETPYANDAQEILFNHAYLGWIDRDVKPLSRQI